MLSFSEESFGELAGEVAFCLANIRHPQSTLATSGRFYEDAAEALRGHAILRLLVDGNDAGFASDLAMSAHARRAFLRRCAQAQYEDYFLAFSRSGAFLDAVASNNVSLALEVFRLSPSAWRPGDEYEADFWHQRFLGLCLSSARAEDLEHALEQFERAAEGKGARLALCRVLLQRDASAFEDAFQELLRQRGIENTEDASLADEQLVFALGAKVFVEGVAILKLARHLGLPIAPQYPMCPTLALLPRAPVNPVDEFATP